jgi:hypothetical protein
MHRNINLRSRVRVKQICIYVIATVREAIAEQIEPGDVILVKASTIREI